jgi:hypothetical protein
MLMRGPRWEDYFIPIREWPQALADEFAIDGLLQQVQIL